MISTRVLTRVTLVQILATMRARAKTDPAVVAGALERAWHVDTLGHALAVVLFEEALVKISAISPISIKTLITHASIRAIGVYAFGLFVTLMRETQILTFVNIFTTTRILVA